MKYFDFSNVTKLNLSNLGRKIDRFSFGGNRSHSLTKFKFSSFCFNLLFKFPIIEYLSLRSIHLTDSTEDVDDNAIKKWFPNLKGIGIGFHCCPNTRNFCQRIICVLGDRIEALSFYNYGKMVIKCQKFPKLNELIFDISMHFKEWTPSKEHK